MESPSYFLGLQLDLVAKGQVQRLHQRQYVTTLLTRFRFANENPVLMPMAAAAHFRNLGVPLDADLKKAYQELVRASLYLRASTQSDFSYAVGRLRKFVAAPTEEDVAAGKVVLRYLRGSANFGLCYTTKGALREYCDADFAADRDTSRSTLDFSYLYGCAAIEGKKVSAICSGLNDRGRVHRGSRGGQGGHVDEWVCLFLTNIAGSKPLSCASQGALSLMHNPVTSARTNHIDVSHHLVRERVADETLTVHHVGSAHQTADILTKPLRTVAFGRCDHGLGTSADAQDAPRGGVLEQRQLKTGVRKYVPPPPDGTGLSSATQHLPDTASARVKD